SACGGPSPKMTGIPALQAPQTGLAFTSARIVASESSCGTSTDSSRAPASSFDISPNNNPGCELDWPRSAIIHLQNKIARPRSITEQITLRELVNIARQGL